MARIAWDRIEDRAFETGTDHAVLYVPDENDVFRGVAWNGLTSVVKDSSRETETTYFDGLKIHGYVKQTQFKGSMRAVMYPPEFEELEGQYEIKCGVSLGEQPPGLFCLAYRTMIGDTSGEFTGYKLHILYNLQATPSSRSYETLGESPKIVDFSWDLESMPDIIPGFKPSSEITLDSRKVDPWLLSEIEDILFGTDAEDSYLPPIAELIDFINNWYRLKITIDTDPDSLTYGVFTIEEGREGTYITENNPDGSWVLSNVDAVIYDEFWYTLQEIACVSPTTGASVIQITELPDGRWVASTDHDELITIDNDGKFTIHDATLVWQTEELYRITDTKKT